MSYESLFLNKASTINEEDVKLSTEEDLEDKVNEVEVEEESQLAIEKEGNTFKIIVKPVITNTIGAVSLSVTAAAEAADYAACAAAAAAEAVTAAEANHIKAAITAATAAANYAADAAIKAAVAAGGNSVASDNACNATASARKANVIANKNKYR